MNCNRFSTMLLSIALLTIPLAAIASPSPLARSIAPTSIAQESLTQTSIVLTQAEPTARQVLEACVQNRAATLPNPFVDVTADHWAFKAVLMMHYCGAYRQATPASLVERLTQQSSVQPTLPMPAR